MDLLWYFNMKCWSRAAFFFLIKASFQIKSSCIKQYLKSEATLGQFLPSLLHFYIVVIDWFLHDGGGGIIFAWETEETIKRHCLFHTGLAFTRGLGMIWTYSGWFSLPLRGHLEKVSLKFCPYERQGRTLGSREIPSEAAAPKVHSDTSLWVVPENPEHIIFFPWAFAS